MTPLPYWKVIGGYAAAVKVAGRWYFIGATHADMVAARDGLGRPFVRVSAMPPTISRLWRQHGCTIATMKAHLPHWTTAPRPAQKGDR